MELTRAKQILNAEQTIKVSYNGQPVWIDTIDTESSTARIHMEHQPDSIHTVSVEQLQEA